MRREIPRSFVRLLQPLGILLWDEGGTVIVQSPDITIEVSLGMFSLAFLCKWLKVGFPYLCGVMTAGQTPVQRSGDVETLRTCFVGCKMVKLPGLSVWEELISHASKNHVFHVCYESAGGMCADVEFLVLGNGWSWSSDSSHIYVSNAGGASTGLPPSPEVLGLPPFLEFFKVSPPSPWGACILHEQSAYAGAWLAMQDFLDGPSVYTANNFVRAAVVHRRSSYPSVRRKFAALLPLGCVEFASHIPAMGLTRDQILDAFACVRVSTGGRLTM